MSRRINVRGAGHRYAATMRWRAGGNVRNTGESASKVRPNALINVLHAEGRKTMTERWECTKGVDESGPPPGQILREQELLEIVRPVRHDGQPPIPEPDNSAIENYYQELCERSLSEPDGIAFRRFVYWMGRDAGRKAAMKVAAETIDNFFAKGKKEEDHHV